MWRQEAVGCFGRSGWFVIAMLAVSACGASDDTPGDSSGGPASTRPAATDLAPSQLNASTVPAPAAPALCDPDDVRIEVVAPDGGIGQPDQIVEFVNEGDRVCDVDISATASAAEEMEPSVRLAPGEVGLAWIAGIDGCVAAGDIEFDVNGEPRVVELPGAGPCDAEVIAFFTD